ncbi:MAG: orotidine-5'-phosphate decarboxylase [Acidimicrobiales bacterium]|nr:orotidine-5'-phosphate decarboxylase [Acidimicrobiales bacterium]
MTATSTPQALRSRLAVAIDVDDAVAALRIARELQPWIGVAKVGLELYSAAGPDIVGGLSALGLDVFCDLKFHDIPTTVHRAARVVGSLGARYLNFHAQGGVAMLTAGVDGFLAGAAEAGLPAPTALAVTILTSDGDAPPHILGKRVQAALEAGCGGVVCAASDVPEVKRLGPRLVAVVPGIRPVGTDAHDQARVATPDAAIAAGADLLVLGRAVTRADDPAAAAAAIATSIERLVGS